MSDPSGYYGSEPWVKAATEARDQFRVPRDVEENGVRFVEAEAGTGSRYTVVSTPLPQVAAMCLGGGSHLITVVYPWSVSYMLQRGGDLHWDYLMEKFVSPAREVRKTYAGDLMALAMTIAEVTGRELTGIGFLNREPSDA